MNLQMINSSQLATLVDNHVTIGGNADWYNHCGKTVWSYLKKIKLELPYDPAIPLLGIYPKKPETLIRKNICTPMFIAALFTISKILKKPKCPSVDEWVKQLWYIYTMEYYSIITKKILPHAWTWRTLC